MRLVGSCLLILFTAGFSGGAGSEEAIDHGRALVFENCSGCHAIGTNGDSPQPQAPPFRELSKRFPIDALEEAFVTSIDTGHPGMPVFKASREQIADIITYIASVME